MSAPRNVKCPNCQKSGDWTATPSGPFCSHHCKLIDLDKWFSEEHAITEPLRPGHFAQFEELPPGENPDAPEK